MTIPDLSLTERRTDIFDRRFVLVIQMPKSVIDMLANIVYTKAMETVPRRPATIRDVARKAGVGLGTVSRVINGSPLVSDATRQRVQEVVSELNFVPSSTARRLSTGKTMTFVAIVPFFTRPSMIERLRGIQETIAGSPYDLVIYNVETAERRDYYFREVPRRDRADGVLILSLSPRDDDLPYLRRAEVPIVFVDANHPSLSGFFRVVVDDVQGSKVAVQHLLDLGHRRIGYISDKLENPFNFTSSKYRFDGYCQALTSAGVPVLPEYIGHGEHGRYEARRMALEILSLEARPTAIFTASDSQAMGVLEAARILGLHIPDDLSVIGYDDIEVAEYLNLTTMRQMLFESGETGIELLMDLANGWSAPPVVVEQPTELIVRGTTGPAPA